MVTASEKKKSASNPLSAPMPAADTKISAQSRSGIARTTLLNMRTIVLSTTFGLPNLVDQSASGSATDAPVTVPITAS